MCFLIFTGKDPGMYRLQPVYSLSPLQSDLAEKGWDSPPRRKVFPSWRLEELQNVEKRPLLLDGGNHLRQRGLLGFRRVELRRHLRGVRLQQVVLRRLQLHRLTSTTVL